MDEIQLDANDVISALRDQRNDALDEVAMLRAKVAALTKDQGVADDAAS